tara:strand:- start:1388 stop:2434 length:1047 start_codon:yes stop_codon:yes gene_type:complete
MKTNQAENTHDNDEDNVSADIDRAWAEHENDDDGGQAPDPSFDAGSETAFDPALGAESGADNDGSGDNGEKHESDDIGQKQVSEKAREAEVDKPPTGLSAAAREAWKTAPKELKADIIKRERDYSVGLQKNAEWAQRARQMDSALAPYQTYMSMNGGAQSVTDLLQTASTLQMGSPQQKAEAAAQIIKHFGVDIQSLDTLLSGQPLQQQQPQLSERDQRMDAFFAQQEQLQHQERQMLQNQVNQSVGEFMADPANEFADLVRDDMADLLDGASRRGIAMTMAQAYTKACRMRDDIAPILESRNSSQSIQRRRNAASSISGAPGGTNMGKEPDSIREALEHAFDNIGQI